MASRLPQPTDGCVEMSWLMMATVPIRASASPAQKRGCSFSLNNSSAPRLTHSGEVLPNRVALAAEVRRTDVFHAARSAAKKSPPSAAIKR